MLAVQKEKQEANATEALLQRHVEIAEEAHSALALIVEEKRITSQDTNTGISLTSRSAVPSAPTGQRRSTNTLAAVIGVIILAILVIVVITWWNINEGSVLEPNSESGSTGEHIAPNSYDA